MNAYPSMPIPIEPSPMGRAYISIPAMSRQTSSAIRQTGTAVSGST